MSRQSILLLDTTVDQVSPIGGKVKGAAYYGNSSGNHAIAVYAQNLTGRLTIEASLATNPTDSDWFEVKLDQNSEFNYLEYTETTGVFISTFKGNYVWVRARLDRSYLETTSDPGNGYISKILLNY